MSYSSRMFAALMLACMPALGQIGAETPQPQNGNSALGQSGPPAEMPQTQNGDLKKSQDFRVLFDERETLTADVRKLEREIDELDAEIRRLPSEADLQKQIRDTKNNINTARKDPKGDQTNYADYLQGQLESLEANLKTIREDKPAIKKKQAEVDRKEPRLRAVEQRIASLFDDNQYVNRFRIWVAVAFSALVFAVIVGFYWIVNKHKIATTIFSGEMGMQFVTLFLIVIAIILFGIIGTLEGRELAALLGGLSGYILGRVSDTGRRASTGQDRKEEPT